MAEDNEREVSEIVEVDNGIAGFLRFDDFAVGNPADYKSVG